MKSPMRMQVLTVAFCLYAVSTLISMAVMSVASAILVAALIWGLGGPRAFITSLQESFREESLRGSPWLGRYLGISVLLALCCFLSLVAGKLWPLSFGGQYSPVHVVKDSLKLWYLFWPLPLLLGLKTISEEQRRKILICWIGACALLGMIAIVQHFIGWPRPQPIPSSERPFRYHATLFLGHHLSVASIFIFPFFAALDFLRRRPGWLWAAGSLFGGIALVLTYSRTLWAALPIALAVWVLINLPRRWAGIFLILLVVGVGAATRLPSVQNRFANGPFQEGVGPRADLWKANLEMVKERPILGVGWKHNQELSGFYLMQKYPGQSVFSGHAHNNVLDMLGGTGILGAVAWIAWSALAIAMAWVAWRRKSGLNDVFASGLLCAWIAFQINGITQVNFWEAKVTHQIMWMIAWSLLWLRSPA